MNFRNIIIASALTATTLGTLAYAQTATPTDTEIEQVLTGDPDTATPTATNGGGERRHGNRGKDCDGEHEGRRGDRHHDDDDADDYEETDTDDANEG